MIKAELSLLKNLKTFSLQKFEEVLNMLGHKFW